MTLVTCPQPASSLLCSTVVTTADELEVTSVSVFFGRASPAVN
jgi:hypothetical protein